MKDNSGAIWRLKRDDGTTAVYKARARVGGAAAVTVRIVREYDGFTDALRARYHVGVRFPLMGVSAVDSTAGGTWASQYDRQVANYGAKSVFVYYTPGQAPQWSDRCASVPADHDIVVSTKKYSTDALWVSEHRAFVNAIPTTRSGKVFMVANEEPETDMSPAEFKRRWGLVRSMYEDHPRTVPTVCLQAWTSNPASGRGGIAAWVPDWMTHIGWSPYANATQIRTQAKIQSVDQVFGPVAAAMKADGRAWSTFALGCGVVTTRDPIGGSFRAARAQWAYDAVAFTAANGGRHAMWFDRYWPDAGVDYRINYDPALKAKWMQATADFGLQGAL